MPSASDKKKHGGVARVRTKRLPDGTLVRIYFYKDGKSYADRARKGARKARRVAHG